MEPEDVYRQDSGLLVGRTACTVRNGFTLVRIVNVSEASIELHKDTPIGFFHAAVQQGVKVARVGVYELIEMAPAEKEQTKRAKCVPDVDLTKSKLSEYQKHDVQSLLSRYSDVFAKDSTDLGRTNIAKHTITTGDAPPVKQAYRRVPGNLRDEVQKQTASMLSNGIIEESKSAWSSPVVLAKKKDGSLRFCVDYRRLNAVTHKDAHPLPRVDDCLDALSGATIFSTLDCASGYWQVEMDEVDREKTAFSSGNNLYHFRVMPFGLTNAPATFQRLMDLVLSGLHWTACLVYLDDVILFTKTVNEHMRLLEDVLTRLRQAGLKLKPSKCHLFQDKVSFLGHEVSKDGTAPETRNIEKVKNFPVPRSIREVKSFVSLASYYRRFVHDFSLLAEPLLELTRKDVEFVWTDQCQKSFETLRDALTHYPILAFPDFQEPFILMTDASKFSVGAVLSQIQQGEERVIGYASASLTSAGRNWSTFDKEYWGVVWGVRHFRPYLCGKRFKIYTDHKPLLNIKSLNNDSDPTGRRTRWSIELSSYEYDIHYKKGEENTNADCMSRIPISQTDVHNATQEDAPPSGRDSTGIIENINVAQEQDKDPALKYVKDMLRNNDHRSGTKQTAELTYFCKQRDKFKLSDDILYRYGSDQNGNQHRQIVVPKQLTRVVLEAQHSCATGGHLGLEKTQQKIQLKYFWYSMHSHIKNWCKCCEKCAAAKSDSVKPRAPLVQEQSTKPFERLAMDIVGPVTTSLEGNRFILVVTDYFTKWPEAFPLKDHKATTVARVLVDEIICRYGIPQKLHSDQGRDFESNVIQELCTLLDIKKTRTTPYHPASDGLVERLNRTLVQMLRTVVNDDQKDWDKKLPKVLLAYRSSVHSTTKFTPHFLMFGREVQLPVDVMFGGMGERFQSQKEYVQKTKAHLDEAFQMVRSNSKTALKQQKKVYDKKIHGSPFEKDDTVMIYCPAVKQGLSKKLHKCWDGPWSIVKKISDVIYRVKKKGARRRMVVHFNRLRKFESLPAADTSQEPTMDSQSLGFEPRTFDSLPAENTRQEPAMDSQTLGFEPSSDNPGPGILVGIPGDVVDRINETPASEGDDDSVNDIGSSESDGADSDSELNVDTRGAYRTRSGRNTNRPARLRDYVV
ncbi:MAG: reverse transcriptase domain-containing protein [Sedimenticola sp.]